MKSARDLWVEANGDADRYMRLVRDLGVEAADDREYPRHPLGLVDVVEVVPPKPCAKRIDHAGGELTWCTQADGHAGQCSGPFPHAIDTGNSAPRRKS